MNPLDHKKIEMKPLLKWPRFPDFPSSYLRQDKMSDTMRAMRWFYDWTVFTPEGLKEAEAYWNECTRVLEQLLPVRFSANRPRWSGINLGTFTGTFQKAWMRLGYGMYGIELHPVIDDLRAYGCEGHQDSVFDLSRIGDATFYFAILDRVFCQKTFYDRYEQRRHMDAPPYFSKIRRILKNDGAFIGVLYDWYSRCVVEELASLGGLTLWPMKGSRISFRVDLALLPSQMPDVMREPLDSPYFANTKIGATRMKWFLPANEIVREPGGAREVVFAPPLREGARPRKPQSAKRKAPGT